MKRSKPSRIHRRVSLVLAFIFAFVISQAIWWLIFLRGFVDQVTTQQHTSWALEQLSLRSMAAHPDPTIRKQTAQLCRRFYPHFHCDNPIFPLRKQALAVIQKQKRYVRMFAWEGVVFVLFVVGGLYLLLLAMRTERDFRQRQQNFLSAVSHEMRTPIGAMRLIIDSLLMRSYEHEKRERYLQKLSGQLDRLQNTCEHVLAAAMLEDSERKIRTEVRDLAIEVQSQLDTLSDIVDPSETTVSFVPGEEPLFVQIDTLAIGLIVKNLVENAIKYNPKPWKNVTLSLHKRGNTARLDVSDDGAGVPESERDKIFDAFYRVGSEMTRERPGLGLGLHLVKELAQTMGGEVEYNALEPGSRFSITLPLVPVSKNPVRADHERKADG